MVKHIEPAAHVALPGDLEQTRADDGPQRWRKGVLYDVGRTLNALGATGAPTTARSSYVASSTSSAQTCTATRCAAAGATPAASLAPPSTHSARAWPGGPPGHHGGPERSVRTLTTHLSPREQRVFFSFPVASRSWSAGRAAPEHRNRCGSSLTSATGNRAGPNNRRVPAPKTLNPRQPQPPLEPHPRGGRRRQTAGIRLRRR
jgi:hypothetical protein